MDTFEVLRRAALAIPVTLPPPALLQCKSYVDTLLLWRRRLSLTSASTPQSVVLDHILDSLYLAPFIKSNFRVADIGSGAGFPGIPLAIALPAAHFVLIESRRKKANFLREVARKARLANVEVAEQRAEALPADGAQSFDVVMSRALGAVSDLLALADRLLKRDGLVIAMKGPKGRAELAEHPGFAAADTVEYQLPSGAQHLLLIHHREAARNNVTP